MVEYTIPKYTQFKIFDIDMYMYKLWLEHFLTTNNKGNLSLANLPCAK